MKTTMSIIAVCAAIFILQSIIPGFTSEFSLTPSKALSGHVWQFVTYMFLHGDPVHIFLNMFALLIFGIVIENTLGRKKYLTLFFISGIASSVIYLLITVSITPAAELSFILNIPMLGASGAVFGVLAAYGLLYPKNWIIMFPGIPMPAWIAVIAFAGMEIFYGLTGSQPGIANWGHLGGLAIGAALMIYWKKKKSAKPDLIIDETAENEKGWEFVWE